MDIFKHWAKSQKVENRKLGFLCFFFNICQWALYIIKLWDNLRCDMKRTQHLKRFSLTLWSCVMPESPELSDERHQGLPRGTQGKCRYPGAALEGSHPHPQTAGSCRSPASHPCTRPSEQGPGIPTPPEWIQWPHPQRLVVPEMKPRVTKRAMKVLISCKRERVVRGKDWLGWSMCSNRSKQGYLDKLRISNFNFLQFFIRPYEILQLIWIFHHSSKSMNYI